MAENLEENVSAKLIEIGDEDGIENVPGRLKDGEKPEVVILIAIKCSLALIHYIKHLKLISTDPLPSG